MILQRVILRNINKEQLCYYKSMKQLFFHIWIPLLFSVLVFSCVSRNVKLTETDNKVNKGDFAGAYSDLQEKKADVYNSKKDEILYLLDSGMLALLAQNTPTAIAELSAADLQMEDLRKKNIGEQIAASLVNDSVITYNGYNYEYVFTSLMLSLGYLVENKFDDGFVEMRRTQDKLTKIQVDNDVLISEYSNNKDAYVKLDEIKEPFVDSAFARLLSLWLYRADFDRSNMEVAAKKYVEAINAQPLIYDFEYSIVSDEHLSMEGNRIQVVTLTERIPILFEKRFSLNAVEGGLIVGGYTESSNLGPNLTPIKQDDFFNGIGIIAVPGMDSSGFSVVFASPQMAIHDKKVDKIEIWANEKKLGELSVTENLEQIAVNSFKEESKFIFARQISRVIIKSTLGVLANEVDPMLGLLTQVVNNVSENADTRIARYFPARIWTGDFPVPSIGDYNVSIRYYNNGAIVRQKDKTISITKENDTFNLVIDFLL